MQAKPKSLQTEWFKISLAKIINTKHPLCILGAKIKWSEFDAAFGSLYSEGKGRPAKPTRLMVGLHYLKRMYNLSDEEVVSQSFLISLSNDIFHTSLKRVEGKPVVKSDNDKTNFLCHSNVKC